MIERARVRVLTEQSAEVLTLTRCGRLRGKWSIGVWLSGELDDFIIRVQGRWFSSRQWRRRCVFVGLPSLLYEHEVSGNKHHMKCPSLPVQEGNIYCCVIQLCHSKLSSMCMGCKIVYVTE